MALFARRRISDIWLGFCLASEKTSDYADISCYSIGPAQRHASENIRQPSKLNRIKAIVVLVLLGLGLIVATAPGASAATYCGTYTKTWYLSDGSVITIRIMTIKTHLEVCTDGRSVTAAYESVESSFTGPGVTAGWHGGYGPTYRTSFDSNRGAWFSSNGYLRDCESHYTALLCSRSEGYLVNSSVVIQPIVVVKPAAGQLKIGGRVFTFSFSPHDSSGSQVHFNNTI